MKKHSHRKLSLKYYYLRNYKANHLFSFISVVRITETIFRRIFHILFNNFFCPWQSTCSDSILFLSGNPFKEGELIETKSGKVNSWNVKNFKFVGLNFVDFIHIEISLMQSFNKSVTKIAQLIVAGVENIEVNATYTHTHKNRRSKRISINVS